MILCCKKLPSRQCQLTQITCRMYYKESSSEGICPYNYNIYELKEEMHQKHSKFSFPIGHLKTHDTNAGWIRMHTVWVSNFYKKNAQHGEKNEHQAYQVPYCIFNICARKINRKLPYRLLVEQYFILQTVYNFSATPFVSSSQETSKIYSSSCKWCHGKITEIKLLTFFNIWFVHALN